jgi:hypothetical protein
VVLVDLGLWTDGSSKRRILDWEVAQKQEQAPWERLVQRLWERGVKLETGLQVIVRDGSEGLEQAQLVAFGEQRRPMQPQAVATFEREAGADDPLLFVRGGWCAKWCVRPPSWNARIANCGARFGKWAVSVVREALRWQCTFK